MIPPLAIVVLAGLLAIYFSYEVGRHFTAFGLLSAKTETAEDHAAAFVCATIGAAFAMLTMLCAGVAGFAIAHV